MDPTIVVLISFVIFMSIAYRFGFRQAMAVLDQKIDNIRQALDDGAQAKEAAIQALHEERRRHEEILEEIQLIAKRTEEQALILRQQALQDINQMITLRQQAAEHMLERMHTTAVGTIQKQVTTSTIATFEALITKEFSSAQHEALNDGAIAQISAQLTRRHTINAPKPKRLKSKRSAAK